MSKYFFGCGRYAWGIPFLLAEADNGSGASLEPSLRHFQEAWRLYQDIHLTASIHSCSQAERLLGIDVWEYGVGHRRMALPERHREFYAVLEQRLERVLLMALIGQRLVVLEATSKTGTLAPSVLPSAA